MRRVVESGEMLARLRKVRGSNVPIQIQVLEPDFLVTDHTTYSASGKNTVVQGVEHNAQEKRLAYHLWDSHPGNLSSENLASGDTSKINRMPAEDIAHVYRTDRAGQVRGVSWLAPAILRLSDIRDYENAQLVRQKIAACYAGFIYDAETSDFSSQSQRDVVEKFEPGMLEYLPPGKRIEQ